MKFEPPQDPAGSPDLESQVNAFIDGELSPEAAEALKARAAEDGELARMIVDAWQLQRALDDLPMEKAPSRLHRRLKQIPREHRPRIFQVRWLAGAALASVALVAVAMMMSGPGEDRVAPGPSGSMPRQAETSPAIPAPGDDPAAELTEAEKIRQARHELAVAFSYIDRIGLRTAREMQNVLYDELAEPVNSQIFRHFPYTVQNTKEKHS